MKRAYRRHLPHQIPESTPIFVTFCLKGALPKNLRIHIHREKMRLQSQPLRAGESALERRNRLDRVLFGILDRMMDLEPAGPLHLKDGRNAEIVENAILFGTDVRYDLLAWCVMANHVHVLLTPRSDFHRLMQGIKGYSAYQINQLMNRTGRAFWLDESYDHWPRDQEELDRIIYYIEANPVNAGLCRAPADWRWSSAARRANWPIGSPFRASMGLS